jgi:hypothetical protein
VPDWTYAPLVRPVLRRVRPHDAEQVALRTVAGVARLPGGWRLLRTTGWSYPLAGAETVALGRRLPSPVVEPCASALDALGAGFVVVGPVRSPAELHLEAGRGLRLLRIAPGGVPAFAEAPTGVHALVVAADDLQRSLALGLPVLVDASDAASAESALRAGAAGVCVVAHVLPDLPRDTLALVPSAATAPEDVADLVRAGATLVALEPSALKDQGPGLPQRCAEALASRAHPPPTRVNSGFLRSSSVVASLLIGSALVLTGVGAAVISFGPVLLGYDRAFLGGGTEVLDVGRLLPFVRHDRITFAGVGLSIGVLYLALAWWGVRLGRSWARATLALSCAVGMTTLLLFLGFGYFDPLHALVTALLLPLLLVAVLRPLPPPSWRLMLPTAEAQFRQRALAGQLLLVVVAVGLLGGGLVIGAISVTTVFVGSDIAYLQTTAQDLQALSDRIVPFVAHDRAGFGGALVAQGIALLGLALWAVRPGESWLWWTLLAAGVAAGVPTVAIHVAVGYTDLGHLAPVYLAGTLTAVALLLTRRYLLAPATTSPRITAPRVGVQPLSGSAVPPGT